jgi:hypothetical protein
MMIFITGCENSQRYLVKNASAEDVYLRLRKYCTYGGVVPYYENISDGVMLFNLGSTTIKGSAHTTGKVNFYDDTTSYNQTTYQDPDINIQFSGKMIVAQQDNDVIVYVQWSSSGINISPFWQYPFENVKKAMKDDYEIYDQ